MFKRRCKSVFEIQGLPLCTIDGPCRHQLSLSLGGYWQRKALGTGLKALTQAVNATERFGMKYGTVEGHPAGNRISKRNQKDTGQDIRNSCSFEIRNDIIC